MRFLRTHPGFSMLWAINFTSSMVGWSMGIALSVHIYQLTGSALWTAILAATPTVSAIVFGHLAGTVADRWNPPASSPTDLAGTRRRPIGTLRGC